MDYSKLVIPEHRLQSKFMEWLDSAIKPLQSAQNCMNNLYKKFDIDNAVGVQLDKIGDILGVSRKLPFQPNDFFTIPVVGSATFNGSGDASPDNVRAIHGVKSITISDGGDNSQVINLPQELFSLPDGTADSYDVVNGKGTQKVGKIVLDGSQTISYETAYTNTAKFTFVTSNIGFASPIIAGNFETINNSNSDVEHIASWSGWVGINIFILKSRLAGWSDGWTDAQKVTAFKSWLSANPVTVLYELAIPRAITGTEQTINKYLPVTYVYQTVNPLYNLSINGNASQSTKGFYEANIAGNPLSFSASGTKLWKANVIGNSVQDGSGDVSPDNVRNISGVTSVTISSTKYTLPQTLYLVDGLADEYDITSGTGTSAIQCTTLSGTWSYASDDGTLLCVYLAATDAAGDNYDTVTNCICNRFQTISRNQGGTKEGISVDAERFQITINVSRLTGWNASLSGNNKAALFDAWIANNPVTVLYERNKTQAITGTTQTITAMEGMTAETDNGGSIEVTCLAQNGTNNVPSQNNICPVTGTSGITVNDTTYSSPILYSLPDGTADTYDVITGTRTIKVGSFALDGAVRPISHERGLNNFSLTFSLTDLGFANTEVFSAISPWGDKKSYINRHGYLVITGFQNSYFGIVDDDTDDEAVAKILSWYKNYSITFYYRLATDKTVSGKSNFITIAGNTSITSECIASVTYLDKNSNQFISSGQYISIYANTQKLIDPYCFSAEMLDSNYRFVLKAAIIKEHSNGTMPNLYGLLEALMGNEGLYFIVIDNQDMSAEVIVFGKVSSLVHDELIHDMIIPRPEGVSMTITVTDYKIFSWGLSNEVFGGWGEGYWMPIRNNS